ncbi:hypothetical protein FRC03_005507 [Tulasnella sp. 419]|nr:hypothetical protein FRC03_005507 [Tulasnella sp. 419]
MATLLPPPKRIKRTHGTAEPRVEPEPVTEQAPSVVVQLISEDDGTPMGAPINLQADLARDALELLANTLQGQADDPVPFAFHVPLPQAGESQEGNAPSRIAITSSLMENVLNAKSGSGYTPEDVIPIYCTPQAVFRVRPATRCSSTLTGHSSPILCASFSPTGRLLATGSGDTTARLWDLDTETPSHTLTGHKGWVLCVEWEGRERILASGGHDGHVRLWDPIKGKAIGDAMKGHSKWVTSLAWEPIHIVSSTSSKIKPTARLTGHQSQVSHVAFSPDGRWAASAGWDRSIRIWEGRTGKYICTLRGHIAPVYRLAWSADSRLLISASKDSTLKIWSLKTQKLHTDLPGHTDEVYCVDFVADKVVSGGRDGAVKIWKN